MGWGNISWRSRLGRGRTHREDDEEKPEAEAPGCVFLHKTEGHRLYRDEYRCNITTEADNRGAAASPPINSAAGNTPKAAAMHAEPVRRRCLVDYTPRISCICLAN